MKKTKAEVLMAAGYSFSRSAFHDDADYIWAAPNGAKFQSTNFAKVTDWAHEHLEAQQEALAQAANDAAGEAAYNEVVEENVLKQPFPKFMVGQVVVGYGHEGAITAIRQIDGHNEYVFENSFPSNAWFHEDELWTIDEPAAPSYESLLEEIATLRQQLADAQAENARLLEMFRYAVWALDPFDNDDILRRLQNTLHDIVYNGKPVPKSKELNDALTENARYKVGLKLLVKTMDEALETFCKAIDCDDYKDARNQANDILVVVNRFSTNPAPVPVADAPQPLAEVTLTEDEIERLAVTKVAFVEDLRFLLPGSDNMHRCNSGYYALNAEYDTPANRAAIEARRKQLGL